MGILQNIGKALVSGADKLKGTKVEKTLDVISAIAKNPLAILSPIKEAEKIKELRTTGTPEELKSYIKTTAVQTALNVGGVLAGAGALGAGGKLAATSAAKKGLIVGATALPFIVGSSTIREKVAATSPVEIAVQTAEKIEKKVKEGDEKYTGISNVVGLLGAGAIGAGLVAGGKMLYEDWKDGGLIDSLPSENTLSVTQPVAASSMPVTSQTMDISTSTNKRRRRKAKTIPMNVSQRVVVQVANKTAKFIKRG